MPRLWAATGDPRSAAECGRRGIINTLVLRGPDGTRKAWESYRQARREAGTAFGVPDVFIEKFVRKAKHIEVQILGKEIK